MGGLGLLGTRSAQGTLREIALARERASMRQRQNASLQVLDFRFRGSQFGLVGPKMRLNQVSDGMQYSFGLR